MKKRISIIKKLIKIFLRETDGAEKVALFT